MHQLGVLLLDASPVSLEHLFRYDQLVLLDFKLVVANESQYLGRVRVDLLVEAGEYFCLGG